MTSLTSYLQQLDKDEKREIKRREGEDAVGSIANNVVEDHSCDDEGRGKGGREGRRQRITEDTKVDGDDA